MKRLALIIITTFSLTLSAMEATLFQVGQGNCIPVSCPGEESLLSDAGSSACSL